MKRFRALPRGTAAPRGTDAGAAIRVQAVPGRNCGHQRHRVAGRGGGRRAVLRGVRRERQVRRVDVVRQVEQRVVGTLRPEGQRHQKRVPGRPS